MLNAEELTEIGELSKGEIAEWEIVVLMLDAYCNKCKFVDYTKDVVSVLEYASTESGKWSKRNVEIIKNPEEGHYGHLMLDFDKLGFYWLHVKVLG